MAEEVLKKKVIKVNSKQLINLFGYKNTNYIYELVKLQGAPGQCSRNQYDLIEWLRWYKTYRDRMLEKKLNEIREASPQDLLASRNHELKELTRQNLLGELVDKKEALEYFELEKIRFLKIFNEAVKKISILLSKQDQHNKESTFEIETEKLRSQLKNLKLDI